MDTMSKELSEKWALWYDASCKALLAAFLVLYAVTDEHIGIIVKGIERRLQEKFNTAEKKEAAVKSAPLSELEAIASSERTSERVDMTLITAFLLKSVSPDKHVQAIKIFKAAIRSNKADGFKTACLAMLPLTEYKTIADAVQAYNALLTA